MENYLYIGELRDINGRELGIQDKKIGITSNLDIREFQLTQTKSPIIFRMVKAWRVNQSVSLIEKLLLQKFNKYKIIGEWFEDTENELIDKVNELLKTLHQWDIYPEEIQFTDEQKGYEKMTKYNKTETTRVSRRIQSNKDYHNNTITNKTETHEKPKLTRRFRSNNETVTITVNSQQITGYSVSSLYLKTLKYLIDSELLNKLSKSIPFETSNKRYLISKEPIHQEGNKFRVPIDYNGLYMETHKDYKNGLKHLSDFLKSINVRMTVVHCDYLH